MRGRNQQSAASGSTPYKGSFCCALRGWCARSRRDAAMSFARGAQISIGCVIEWSVASAPGDPESEVRTVGRDRRDNKSPSRPCRDHRRRVQLNFSLRFCARLISGRGLFPAYGTSELRRPLSSSRFIFIPCGQHPTPLKGNDMTNFFDPKYDAVLKALIRSTSVSEPRNALSDLYSPPSNGFGDLPQQPSIFGNALSTYGGIVVRNVVGSGECKCGCGSWLDHHARFSGYTSRLCSVSTCVRTADVGGHVQKCDALDTRWYIVPLCSSCNGQVDKFILSSTAVLVSANVGRTCRP